MCRSRCAALAAALSSAAVAPAFAHAVAGNRIFPVTLTVDDPGVADEASLPTFTMQRQGSSDGSPAIWQYNLGFEFDKTITDRFGVGIADSYSIQHQSGSKTQTGFLNLTVTPKFQAWVNGPHEAIVSVGVIREFGRTGTTRVGQDQYGGTTPTIYAGKGFGDLPVPLLRPFAVTGTFGYTIADKRYKALDTGTDTTSTAGFTGNPAQTFNNGNSNRWVGGLTLQYSLPYLDQQVRQLGGPEFLKRLTPVLEVSWSSPASSPTELPTQLVYAPGVIYSADTYQLGVEALIPGNRASGTNVGVIAQFHVFLDDLFPNSIGKPIFQ